MKEDFAENKKVGRSLLWNLEQKMIKKIVPRVPLFLSANTLTLTSILWSLLIIFFSLLAKNNINWLWLVSFMIVFQYITDSLDGAVGRYRREGFVKWGYYMDHFLDYIFLCSILIGYSFIVEDRFKYLLFFILALFGAFMVNSYLAFTATNKFRISYLKMGPTESRIIFIVINTFLIIFGKTFMAGALPYILLFSLFGLVVVVYKTQKHIMDIDRARIRLERQKTMKK